MDARVATLMRKLFLLIGPALLTVLPAVAQTDAGDAAWARRAAGSRGAVAAPGPIEEAISAYRREVAAKPREMEARWKLLRALRFKGAYVVQSAAEKKVVYSEARKLGDDSIAVLESRTSLRSGELSRGRLEAVAAAVKSVPGAAELLHWDAVAWGEWALVYGKMAALREGAADRIRRSATLTMMIDPRVERGGGARVLGRLHDQTPRVPFVTGWASGSEAVRLLRTALSADPSDRLTKVFLAEALLSSGGSREEARKLLAEATAGAPSGEFAVEEHDAIAKGRAALAGLR